MNRYKLLHLFNVNWLVRQHSYWCVEKHSKLSGKKYWLNNATQSTAVSSYLLFLFLFVKLLDMQFGKILQWNTMYNNAIRYIDYILTKLVAGGANCLMRR